MTKNIERAAGRRTLRRPWRWIALGCAVAVVGIVVIAVLVSMPGNTSSETPRSLLTRVIERTDDTAKAAGGVWAFDDTSPWLPNDTSGYTGVPCGSVDSGPQQYPVQINSAGVANPNASAARVVKHWKRLGYRVREVVPPQADNSQYTEVAADLPNGARIVYSVSTQISGIEALSECSSDPAMRNTTK